MYSYIIVDDESITREGTIKKLEIVSDLVQCIGEAADGVSAITLVEEKNPDIIITDMQMPIMDGLELLPYLAEKYPQKQIIVISGYKDFEYVKGAISANAVDYIVKPFSKETLKATVLKSIARIENNLQPSKQFLMQEEQKEHKYYEYDIQMLQNLILGIHVSNVEINSKQLSFINSTHNMILITMHSKEHLHPESITDFLTSNGFGDLALYLPHINNPHMGFLVLFIPENYVLAPNKLCEQIITEMQIADEGIRNNIIFGISNIHKDLSELHEAFNETSEAIDQHMLLQEISSYFFYVKESNPVIINWEHQDEFLFRVEAGMVDDVEHMITDLFDFYKKLPNCKIKDVKFHFNQLADQMRPIMNRYFLQSNNKSTSIKNVFTSLFRLEDLYHYYIQFFTQISSLLQPQSIYNHGDLIEQVKAYIDNNYQKNLSLEFLASLFYVNRSYLSHLFKTKQGKNYVDYLNEVRITKAKELLTTSKRNLYQIAKAVGYDNVKYFFRVFKKNVGLTPDQYRSKFCEISS